MASARNAVKHGLFRAPSFATRDLSPRVAALTAALTDLPIERGDAGLLIDKVAFAAMRLEQAMSIVRRLRTELDQLFAAEQFEGVRLTALLTELVRTGRYERRFRGQRDRALRALMTPPTPP